MLGFPDFLTFVHAEAANTITFRRQLQRLLHRQNQDELLDRLKKGSGYYGTFMEENLKLLLLHLAEVEQLTRTKTYRNALSEVDQQLMIAWSGLEQIEALAASILSEGSLIKEGKSIKEIASKRSLAKSTIEGHVIRGIREGAIDISEVLGEETIRELTRVIQETKNSLGELHRLENGKYNYGVLRMVHAHLEKA